MITMIKLSVQPNKLSVQPKLQETWNKAHFVLLTAE